MCKIAASREHPTKVLRSIRPTQSRAAGRRPRGVQIQSPRLEPKRLVVGLCDPNPAVEGRPRRYSDGPAPTALLSEKPTRSANRRGSNHRSSVGPESIPVPVSSAMGRQKRTPITFQ